MAWGKEADAQPRGLSYDGDDYADIYDEWYDDRLDTRSAVAFLRSLAPTGHALELGVGTGRLAIPLAASGLRVTGVDTSPRMLEQLTAKAGDVPVTPVLADMSELDLQDSFDLVYVMFSSLFLLTSQEAQVRCFERVASLLKPNGSFVIEAFVPDTTRYRRNQDVSVEDIGPHNVRFELAQHDAANQTISAVRVQIEPSGIRLFPYRVRYAPPAELDLMARLAGLTLVDRFENFSRRAFTSESPTHVSVYRNLPRGNW